MAQKLFEDKIGTLSHSGGTISLTSSRLTIGGQQYSVALSRSIASDVTMAANTRYQIYAVLVAGVPVMRISANENSVGPSGFSSWKLVGSFYANGMSPVAFGSFVNIEGSGDTDWISYLPIWSITSGTPPNLGNGTITGYYRIVGDSFEARLSLGTGSTTTYGSGGLYTFSAPTNILMEAAKISASEAVLGVASGVITSSYNGYDGTVLYGSTSTVLVRSTDGAISNAWSPTQPATWTASTANQTIGIKFTAPISGKSSYRRIKDL